MAATSPSKAPEAPAELSVETDTEYPEVNLDDCPKMVFIESSGNRKIDGAYQRLPKASRGRPGYVKNGEKKPLYLFWNKKWSIGWDFGSSKCCASVKDVPGVLVPCEPYPFVWKVQSKKEKQKEGEEKEKKEREKEKVLAMRVIDGAVLDISREMEELLQSTPDEGAATTKKKGHHKRKALDQPGDATSKQRTDGGAKGDAKARAGGAGAKKEQSASVDEDLKAVEEAAANADDDDEGETGESSASDSDSSDESSSESASASQASPKAAPKAAAAPKAVAVKQEEADSKVEAEQTQVTGDIAKRQRFEQQVRAQLAKIPDKEGQQKRIQRIRQMAEHSGKLKEAYAVEAHEVRALLTRIERELGLKTTASPPGPPPRHLVERKEKLEREKQEKLEVKREEDSMMLSAAHAAPTTPPHEELHSALAADALPHRTAKPVRGVLRTPLARRRTLNERINYHPDHQTLFREVHVASYRGAGEVLWYTMPGSTVHCDHCDKGVPQAMGSLQGAPGQSQFAQNKFLCIECSGTL